MALGVALAAARGASRLEVPENGFTSINPPLGQERGGALTTRSTHPRTIRQFNELLALLEIPIVVANPHAGQTKGELLESAVGVAPAGFAEAAAQTYSCAKPAQFYKGGNTNDHCGACVACLMRRGAFIRAGVSDGTRYLIDHLPEAGLAKFRRERFQDVDAVRRAILTGFDDADLLAIGPFPADFDEEGGIDICQRGLAELARVDL